MHRVQLNRARLDLRLEPVTPLLIKAGDKGAAMLHPELPDIMFVRTGPPEETTVYVPGSSIKGVVRAAAERVLRTVEVSVCDPMDHDSRCHKAASDEGDRRSRSKRTEGEPFPMAPVFKMLCYACRTFGSQAIGSRVGFADAYPRKERQAAVNRTERRSSVAIDRRTGGPSRAKLFDLEVVTTGPFETSIHLENIQLWQMGLIGLVLRDVDMGFVRFGSGKSRGLGQIRIGLSRMVFQQTELSNQHPAPAGVGVLAPSMAVPYGLPAAESDRLLDVAGATVRPSALGPQYEWEGDGVWRMLDACATDPWRAFMAAAERA